MKLISYWKSFIHFCSLIFWLYIISIQEKKSFNSIRFVAVIQLLTLVYCLFSDFLLLLNLTIWIWIKIITSLNLTITSTTGFSSNLGFVSFFCSNLIVPFYFFYKLIKLCIAPVVTINFDLFNFDLSTIAFKDLNFIKWNQW